MNYKYKRFQPFRTKLSIPKDVLERIYRKKATPEDFLTYNLENKVPLICLDNKYRSIMDIVGPKGLKLDWTCILAIKPEWSNTIEEWFQENNKEEKSAEELNRILYKSIKDEYLDLLERSAFYGGPLTKELRNKDTTQYYFEKLGKNFAQTYPDLLYIKDFYDSKNLLLKRLELRNYIHNYEQYKNIPTQYIKNALKTEADKKVFDFLLPLIENPENMKKEKNLLNAVFSTAQIYETENYLPILEESPNIDIDTFLKQSYLERTQKDYFRVSNKEILEYNIGKKDKFRFGEKLNLDILHLIDQAPEYKDIFAQILKENIIKQKDSTIEEFVYEMITKYHLLYDEKLPEKFKQQYPELFLSEKIPSNIKKKFYQRKLLPDDFEKQPDLLVCFHHLDIATYLKDYDWLIELPIDNSKKLEIAAIDQKLTFEKIRRLFKKIVLEDIQKQDLKKLNILEDLVLRISYSNSEEIRRSGENLLIPLLQSEEPLENMQKIEASFLQNNIPYVGKVFNVFKILHPDFLGFEFRDNSKISPVLKNKSNRAKEVIIFSDLLKATFGSNNRSLKKYLDTIEKGYQLFQNIKDGKILIEQLNKEERKTLTIFNEHLWALYNNTLSNKKATIQKSGNLEKDIHQMIEQFSETKNLEYALPDRIIKMFCHFAGFDTCQQVKDYMKESVLYADFKNRINSETQIEIEVEDFIKGIGDIQYLKSTLQNGGLAREFLGSSADSDATPLDTDVSKILKKGQSLEETINQTASRTYGPIWLVLKNNDRFTTTRKSSTEVDQRIDKDPPLNKLEVFSTGVLAPDHYGIRTGFASTEIDYFIVESKNPQIGLEIAMNGFYIPVINKNGELVFSPQDYDEIRKRMEGLKYYEQEEYNFSNYLEYPNIEIIKESLKNNQEETAFKRSAIEETIQQAVANLGLKLKTEIDGDLTEGSIELIDTGSTGRGTNLPNSGDFDFIMRLDKKIISNPQKLDEIKKELLKNWNGTMTQNGDFRLKDVQIEGVEEKIDIDITFIQKTDKISYTTDMCIKDRLETIKEQSEEKYVSVIANIILAKQILKDAKVYKPNRGENPQGGLGGVGIENWILQNGGSFIEAASSFLNASNGKSFQEFKENYAVWDFGENHLAERTGHYPHDNFIFNMNEEGYKKINKALNKYLGKLNNTEYQEGRAIH